MWIGILIIKKKKEKENEKEKRKPRMNMCNKISNVSTVQCIHICFRILFLAFLRWMTTYNSFFPSGRAPWNGNATISVYIEQTNLIEYFIQTISKLALVTNTMFIDLVTIGLKEITTFFFVWTRSKLFRCCCFFLNSFQFVIFSLEFFLNNSLFLSKSNDRWIFTEFPTIFTNFTLKSIKRQTKLIIRSSDY